MIISKLEKNCNNCNHRYIKDIAYDEEHPDDVVICGYDDHYVGYYDEAEQESCDHYEGE
mgnify:CR=1 FL=1